MTKNMISSLVAIILGSIYLVMTVRLPEIAVGDPLGPRIFPTIIGIILTACGLLLLIKELLIPKKLRSNVSFYVSPENKKIVKLIGITSLVGILYALIFETLGYVISTCIFLFLVMMLINKGKRMIENIMVSVLFSVVTYIAFGVLLQLSLPSGVLNF